MNIADYQQITYKKSERFHFLGKARLWLKTRFRLKTDYFTCFSIGWMLLKKNYD